MPEVEREVEDEIVKISPAATFTPSALPLHTLSSQLPLGYIQQLKPAETARKAAAKVRAHTLATKCYALFPPPSSRVLLVPIAFLDFFASSRIC